MNEMIGYIFGSLHNSEQAIGVISKALKLQAKYNKLFTVFMLAAAVDVCLTAEAIKLCNKKVEALSKELEELKNSKGE